MILGFRQFLEYFEDIQEIVGRHFRVVYSSYDDADQEDQDAYGDNELEAQGYDRRVWVSWSNHTNAVRVDFDQSDTVKAYIPGSGKGGGAFTAATMQRSTGAFMRAMQGMLRDLRLAGYRVQADAADDRRRRVYDRVLGRIGYSPVGQNNIFEPIGSGA